LISLCTWLLPKLRGAAGATSHFWTVTSGHHQAGSPRCIAVLGLVKKVLIADSLAGLADVAFQAAALPSQGSHFPTPLYLQGFYLYAFQI
jgi:hypothetical protein